MRAFTGAIASPLPVHHLLKAGYQRRSEWVYTVDDSDRADGEGYTYLSKGLGAPKNDGDSLWAAFSVIGKKWWAGSAGLSYAREGEKTVTSAWHDSDPGNILHLPYDYTTNAFPSGTAQSTFSFFIDCMAYYKDYADVRLGIANRWIRNKDNIESSGAVYSPEFYAELGIHFSDFSINLPK